MSLAPWFLAIAMVSQSAQFGGETSLETVAPGSPVSSAGVASSGVKRTLPAAPPTVDKEQSTLQDLGGLPNQGESVASSVPTALAGPSRWLSELLDEAELGGRPVSLLVALSAARDREQQLAVAQAYWTVVGTVAEHQLCRREAALLDRMNARLDDESLLEAARASAAASIDESAVDVLTARHQLAGYSRMSSAFSELPMPSDRPLAGPYETRFDSMFAARPAPAEAQLMNQSLPLQWKALLGRTRAVEAADAALAATQRDYLRGTGNLKRVFAALTFSGQQKRALIQNVCRYNHDIATYASSVSAGPLDNPTFVAMLIGRQLEPQPEVMAPVGGERFPVRPSGWNQPTPSLAPMTDPSRSTGGDFPATRHVSGQPTPAPDGFASPRPTLDVTPDLLPMDEKLVPVRVSPKQTTEAVAEPTEAPKLPVIPVEEP